MTSHLLVDGNGLACRLWYANPFEVPKRFEFTLRALSNEDGSVPGIEPAKIEAVAWDSPGPTWRHEVFPEYKAGRPTKPRALQLALAECRVLPFCHLQVPGYEADDILATLARGLVARGKAVLVLTEDKDLAQLVGPLCSILRFEGGILGPDQVRERWGVPPERVRHFLSWVGDGVDGLPGVRGIGPKRAIPKALAGEVGDTLTYELTALATVPSLEV